MKKLPKTKGVKELIKDLDEIYSKYIRKKYEVNGVVRCYTCKNYGTIKTMQCGHFHSRKYMSIRWDEKNTRPQCVSCNIFGEGKKPVFANNLIKEYGAEILEELEIKKNNRSNLGRFELGLLIQDYKKKLEELNS